LYRSMLIPIQQLSRRSPDLSRRETHLQRSLMLCLSLLNLLFYKDLRTFTVRTPHPTLRSRDIDPARIWIWYHQCHRSVT
jgi:hypothetical protein